MTPHETLILIALGVAVYVLPTAVAGWRRHKNAEAIAIVNLFLGWTLVGWVVALAWASTAQDEANG